MSESTTPQGGSTTTEPTASAAGEGSTTATAKAAAGAENSSADGSQQFTQDEFNRLVAREKRALRDKYADYDDLKVKAAQLDALEEAKKSDLEKAQDALARMQAERDKAIAERDAKQAEIDRANAITAKAAEYKVDAAMLARMSGDVEDNARFLAERAANAPKYPSVSDGGESSSKNLTMEEINAIKNPAERVRARAEYLQRNN